MQYFFCKDTINIKNILTQHIEAKNRQQSVKNNLIYIHILNCCNPEKAIIIGEMSPLFI